MTNGIRSSIQNSGQSGLLSYWTAPKRHLAFRYFDQRLGKGRGMAHSFRKHTASQGP